MSKKERIPNIDPEFLKEYFQGIINDKNFVSNEALARIASYPSCNKGLLMLEYFGSHLSKSRAEYLLKEKGEVLVFRNLKSTIKRDLGVSDSYFNAEIKHFEELGLFHYCGTRLDKNRKWSLGKREDCHCLEYDETKDGNKKDKYRLQISVGEIDIFNKDWNVKEFCKEAQKLHIFTDDITSNYLAVIRMIGIEYTSIHDDYNVFDKCCELLSVDTSIFTPNAICKYVFNHVIPKRKAKHIKTTDVYISNMVRDLHSNYEKNKDVMLVEEEYKDIPDMNSLVI